MTARSKTTARRKPRWEQLMRESIVDGVVQVLADDGMDKLTMERVAQRAGVAKGTLYAYFQDKKDLVESALQVVFEPLSSRLDQVAGSDAPPAAKLQAMIRTHLAYFDENRETLRVLLVERQRAWSARVRSARYRAYTGRVAAVLDAGVRDGTFRPVDTRKVAGMLVDATISMVADRLFAEAPSAPLDDDVRLVTGVFLKGIEVTPQ